jgi:hypothetical protein
VEESMVGGKRGGGGKGRWRKVSLGGALERRGERGREIGGQ